MRALKKACEPYRQNQPPQKIEFPKPQAGKQTEFYESAADIVFYGGGAGGGKTVGLLVDFAREEFVQNSGYKAVIFRRTIPDLTNEGGIWDTSFDFYTDLGAKSNGQRLSWTWPSDARIRFSHLQHFKTIYRWKSAQIARLGFEELTEFDEEMFFYMLSRCRSTCGIKPKIRATTNPLSETWIAKFISWWWDQETGQAIPERSGKIRYFFRLGQETHWGENKAEIMEGFGDQLKGAADKINKALAKIDQPPIKPEDLIKSFTFIKSSVYDNPALLAKDPAYVANLMALHPVERARLLDGNWKIRYEAGTIFQRTWFDIAETTLQGRTVRFWDIAATAKEMAKASSYYTAGVKMSRRGEYYQTLDMVAEQKGAGAVEGLIVAIARQDGKSVKIRWEQEGGSAGILWCENLKKRLRALGYDADYIKPQGDKVARATPLATDANNGMVSLLRASWNDQYLDCLQRFDGTPNPLINDVTDASSGAHQYLSSAGTQKLPPVQRQKNSPASLRGIFGQ